MMIESWAALDALDAMLGPAYDGSCQRVLSLNRQINATFSYATFEPTYQKPKS